MKATVYCLSLFIAAFIFSSFIINKDEEVNSEINWMTFEEAIEANKTLKKKIFIDIYTDWCGWCKRMDNTTFKDQKIIEKINADYYAVKFNAEQKDSIVYKGVSFKYVPSGRKGFHQLAYSLLDGQLSYPKFVVLNEQEKRLGIITGFQQVSDLEKLLDKWQLSNAQ